MIGIAHRAWQRSPAAAVVVLLLWAATAIIGGAVTLEFLFRLRAASGLAVMGGAATPRFDRIYEAYKPFFVEQLHPHYVFFFGLTGAERLAMGNAVCSLDRQGFREPGPAHAKGRRLAFVLGGSVAFGLYASSNEQTITSHLNRMQSDYFFVNAGVPGFNSTQEQLRLLLEILDHKPALIMTFDGWNDITLGKESTWMERDLPPGTPEGFPVLEEMVRTAQTPWRLPTIGVLFPELNARVEKYFGASNEAPALMPDAQVQAAAAHYNANQARMAELSSLAGARFVSVFQPVASLHRSVPREFAGEDSAVTRFHQQVLAGRPGTFESHDLGAMFDRHFSATPVMNGDLEDATIFIDGGHLHDTGNALVARELLEFIGRRP